MTILSNCSFYPDQTDLTFESRSKNLVGEILAVKYAYLDLYRSFLRDLGCYIQLRLW